LHLKFFNIILCRIPLFAIAYCYKKRSEKDCLKQKDNVFLGFFAIEFV